MEKINIVQEFISAQSITKERISLEFTQHKNLEFWHYFGAGSHTDAFCISSEDISLEEFNEQMVEYLKTII